MPPPGTSIQLFSARASVLALKYGTADLVCRYVVLVVVYVACGARASRTFLVYSPASDIHGVCVGLSIRIAATRGMIGDRAAQHHDNIVARFAIGIIAAGHPLRRAAMTARVMMRGRNTIGWGQP